MMSPRFSHRSFQTFLPVSIVAAMGRSYRM